MKSLVEAKGAELASSAFILRCLKNCLTRLILVNCSAKLVMISFGLANTAKGVEGSTSSCVLVY